MKQQRPAIAVSSAAKEPPDLLSVRSFGGVCDAGFDLYRRHFGAIWLSTALIILPIQLLLTLASNLVLGPIVAQLQTPGATLDAGSTFWLICGGVLFGVPQEGVPGALALLAVILAGAPNCLLFTNAILGRSCSVRAAFVQASPHIGRLLAVWMVGGFAILAVCSIGAGAVLIALGLLQVALGDLFGPIGAVAAVWIGLVGIYAACTGVVALFFVFSTQLVVIEGRSVTDVWDRNRQLVAGRRFRSAWFAAALLPVVVFGLQGVLMASTRMTLASFSVPAAVEAPCRQLADAMFAVFLLPYPVAVTTLLYFGCRSQREGVAIRTAARSSAVLMLLVGILSGCSGAALSQSRPVSGEPSRIHAQVREILEAPEFQDHNASDKYVSAAAERLRKVSDALESSLERFWNAVRRLFHVRTSAPPSIARPAVYAIIGILGVMCAWMLVRVLGTRPRRRRVRTTPRKAERALSAGAEFDPAPESWIRQAEVLAAQNDFRAASRAILIAQLMWLDHCGTIEWRPNRTNGDYLDAMNGAENPQFYQIVSRSMQLVEPRWFGRRPTSNTDYLSLMAAYHQLNEFSNSAQVRPGVGVSGAIDQSGAR